MVNQLLFFEPGNLGGIVFLIIGILVGPPLILAIIGLILFRSQNRKAGKVFFILAGVYLIVGLGICGVLLSGF